jgi:hypothetical protein
MRSDSDLTVIRDLDELVSLIRSIDAPLYLRYSKGPEHDRSRGPSRDYEADVELPGLSVTNISPEPWWSRPIEDWVARRICKYLELGQEADRYPWLLTGTETGRGPDHEPLVHLTEVLGRLDDAVVQEAQQLYESRFDVGDDST